MGLFKNPKSVLAKAIADALAIHFDVDPKRIESNLLQDAKIVLNNVKFHNRVDQLHSHQDTGKTSVVKTSGTVQQVTFSWKWQFSKTKDQQEHQWVQDATLTIQGMKFAVALEWCDTDKLDEIIPPKKEEEPNTTASSSSQQPGKMMSYIQKQVAMIMDSLKLHIRDYEIQLQLPGKEQNVVFGGSSIQSISLGRKVTSGTQQSEGAATQQPPSKDALLNQEVIIESMFVNILEQPSGFITPVMDSFSYKAESVRVSGERFLTGIGIGLQVHGQDTNTSANGGLVFHAGTTQIYVFDQISKLVLAPTRSTTAESNNNETKEEEPTPDLADEEQQVDTSKPDLVSTFEFPLHRLALIYKETTQLSLTQIVVKYRADGTLADIMADRLDVASITPSQSSLEAASKTPDLFIQTTSNSLDDSMKMSIQGIHASLRPTVQLKLTSIDQAFVPGTMELTKAIQNTVIMYQENGVSIDTPGKVFITRLAPIHEEAPGSERSNDGNILTSAQEGLEGVVETTRGGIEGAFQKLTGSIAGLGGSVAKKGSKDEDEPEDMNAACLKEHEARAEDSSLIRTGSTFSTASATTTKISVPLPVSLSVEALEFTSAQADNAKTSLDKVELDLIPLGSDGTRVSVCASLVQNEMFKLVNAACSLILPMNKPDTIEQLHFAAESTNVRAGYSTEDWNKRFSLKEKKRKSPGKQGTAKAVVYKLPNAHIEALKLYVAFKGAVFSTKDTGMMLKPFIGGSKTTQDDLVNHYVLAVMGKSPGFITNAEVFGINAADTSTAMMGQIALAATPIGAVGGLASTAGVDAVKGIISAGKRNRQKEEDDDFHPSDLFMGVWQAAKESAQEGAARRGKSQGQGADIVDWAIGATAHTTKYANENKSRLGTAYVGGGAMIAGTILAGPIGGIAAGIITHAVAGKVVEKVESKSSEGDGDKTD